MVLLENLEGGREKEGLPECGFCEITEGTGDSIPIAERDKAFSIMSLGDGHPLIIPKAHFKDLGDKGFDADQDATLILARKLFPSVRSTFSDLKGANGTRLLINEGSLQHVPHFHIHLQPFRVSNGQKEPIIIPTVEEKIMIADEISQRFHAENY